MDGYITIGTKVDTKGVDTSLKSMEKNITNSMSKVSSSITSTFNYIKFSIVNTGIELAIRSIMNSMEDGITRLDTMKNYENVMSNLGIGSTEAKASIERLSEALRGLPTSLDSAALSVQRLTSANGNIQASTEMFLAMNNAILAGGASASLQATAVEQLSQAYTKGKPDMMEWRTMMMAMPAQLTQVAKVMGFVNADALGEALRKGEVSMNDFMITLTKMNKEGMNGFKSLREQAENATGGISTSLQNVKTALARAWADILDAIGRENIVAFFQTIINVIDALAQRIVAIIRLIGQAINFINNLFGRKTSKKVKDVNNNVKDASNSMNSLGSSGGVASDGMNKATKSAKGLNKELKQLASFDEMNVLQENKTADSGAGAGSSSGAGGADFGSLEDIDFGDIGESAEKAKTNVDGLIAAIMGLLGAVGALKMGLGFLTSLGIGLLIAGVVYAIEGLIAYLNDPSFKNFGKIITGIGIAVAGVALIFGAWPVAVAGALIAILGLIISNWDKIKAWFEGIVKWLTDKSDFVHKVFGDTIGDIYDLFIENFKLVIQAFDIEFKAIKGIFDGIIKFIKGVFTGDWKMAWEGIRQIFGSIWEWIKGTGKATLDVFINVAKAIVTAVGGVIVSVFKTIVNGILGAIENTLNTPIKAVNALIGVINAVPGINLKKLPVFKLPRLAKGGIVNLPAQGVPIGGAIAGEHGQEGVIPLTDSQQMALLGEAIGKYITVNLTNVNQMNGRVISRELKTIQNEDDFLFNR